jgi:hypothetical protein
VENLHNFEMKTIKAIENSWTQYFLLNKFLSFDSLIFRYCLKLNSNNYKKFLLKSKILSLYKLNKCLKIFSEVFF